MISPSQLEQILDFQAQKGDRNSHRAESTQSLLNQHCPRVLYNMVRSFISSIFPRLCESCSIFRVSRIACSIQLITTNNFQHIQRRKLTIPLTDDEEESSQDLRLVSACATIIEPGLPCILQEALILGPKCSLCGSFSIQWAKLLVSYSSYSVLCDVRINLHSLAPRIMTFMILLTWHRQSQLHSPHPDFLMMIPHSRSLVEPHPRNPIPIAILTQMKRMFWRTVTPNQSKLVVDKEMMKTLSFLPCLTTDRVFLVNVLSVTRFHMEKENPAKRGGHP